MDLKELFSSKYADSSKLLQAYADLIKYADQRNIRKTEIVINKLYNMNIDADSLISALLYLPYQNGSISAEYILKDYGKEVFSVLDALFKLYTTGFKNIEEEAENIRKMFVAIAKDVRTILIIICYVLADVLTIDEFSPEIQKARCKMVLDIYAPLASRLGLSTIKSELEDTCFAVLEPKISKQIYDSVESRYHAREKDVELIKNKLKNLVAELQMKAEITGRKKHTYSIYKKIRDKTHSLDNIYDIVALRVIVNTVPECYSVLGKVHTEFVPMQDRFKDYIALPKPNGYQSIHTTVIFNEQPIEIQIRTLEMHRAAEYGVAAHWMYKEKRTKQDTLDIKLGSIRQLMDEQKDLSAEEFIANLKVDIYSGEIFVQTPKGKVLQFPEGATPIDFAYYIHSDIGNKCVGAKINGKMVPINTKLKSGDIIEIVTSSLSKGPSRDWLKLAKTETARDKIRAFFKHEMKDENIKRGKTILEQNAKAQGYLLSKLLDEKYIGQMFERYSFTSYDDMYASVGFGAISSNQVISKLKALYKQYILDLQPKIDTKQLQNNKKNDSGIIIKDLDDVLIRFAGCCSPIAGDEIIGFISRGRGVSIHRKDCVNVKYAEPERLIEAEWKIDASTILTATLRIIIQDDGRVLAIVANEISKNNISIASFEAKKLDRDRGIINVALQIKDQNQLLNITNKIKVLKGVYDVFRS